MAPAPISNLPPEILSKVFLHNTGHCVIDCYRKCPREMGDWFRVTHVCKYWREVALQCAELWSHLHFPDLPVVHDELLARSRDAPLSVILRGMLLECSEKALLSALHRVRTLYVIVDGMGPTVNFLEQMGGRAPLLESLNIQVNNHALPSKIAALHSAISRILSHPETRALRSLYAGLSSVDWTNTPFHGLTRLCVDGGCGQSKTSMFSFLKALNSMHCLEELEMYEKWDVPEAKPFLTIPATFPRLQHLAIYNQGQLLTGELLNSMHSPFLRRLDLAVSRSKLNGDSALLFGAVLQKATTLGPFLTGSYSWHGATFCAYRDICQRTADPKHDSTSDWLEEHPPALKVFVSGDRAPLLDLIASLPLGGIRTFILDRGFPSQGEWPPLTWRMASVTELRVHYGEYDEDKMSKMLSLKHMDLGDGHTPFVLPNLDAVTMDTVTFRSPQTQWLWMILATCFAKRAMEGAKIKALRILRARDLLEKSFERLHKILPGVEREV
ncbi:hypothetical protein C8Q72DRAFT_153776 [Fomitopsis betulina]|nr:hypothetical protein C8Q72DRAFT_153776 [Fomitopsis betulina]